MKQKSVLTLRKSLHQRERDRNAAAGVGSMGKLTLSKSILVVTQNKIINLKMSQICLLYMSTFILQFGVLCDTNSSLLCSS